MNIVKEGNNWWIDLVLTCDVCGAVGTLDESDYGDVKIEMEQSHMGLAYNAEVWMRCPACDKGYMRTYVTYVQIEQRKKNMPL